MNILENKKVILAIKKYGITKQYLKAKENILSGNYYAVDLKKRQPHSENIWYFRISKKYRALAERVNDTLYVFHISDHQ